MDPYTGIFQLHYEPGADGSPRLARLSVVPMRTRHKDGEYRPYLLTDPEEIETCYSRLVAAKPGKGATALPADFVKTGEV